MNKDGNILTSR